MANETKAWFIGERSEALATLFLRSRNDIQIRNERSTDQGADFLIAVNHGNSPGSMLFEAQVKGTTSADFNAWFDDVKQLFKASETSPLYLPTCLFLFNVRDRKARYAWIAEPLIEKEKSAKLRFISSPSQADFHELNESAVDEIIDRVRNWYAVVPESLMPKES